MARKPKLLGDGTRTKIRWSPVHSMRTWKATPGEGWLLLISVLSETQCSVMCSYTDGDGDGHGMSRFVEGPVMDAMKVANEYFWKMEKYSK